ncbi:MAG: hypothetical protein KY457_05345 [Actinobacteria bacterium]|nr:hypothetical protein [Actinomycetota bacterium]
MTIDEKTLKNLIGFRDDQGVLSFYVGFTPEQAADPQPTAPIEIRNQMRDLRNRIRDDHARDLWPAIEARLDALNGQLDDLLDPRAHGRGRALFVAVSDGRSETVAIQMPFRERVIYDKGAYVRPLVAAHDEGRAAGILAVHREGTRLLEWRTGEVEELERQAFELGDAQLADIKSGPSGNNPRHMQEGAVNRERFDDRIDHNRTRFLKGVIADVLETASERGWDRLILAGTEKVRQEVRDELGETPFQLLHAEQSWEETAPSAIADEAWPILRSKHRERECQLIEQAKDRALAGGAGALGLRNVLNALNEGRVAHLLVRSDLELEGYSTEEDTLHAQVGGAAAQAGYEMHPEEHFVERMFEKAITMGGSVTPVDAEAAELLDEHEGIAALLRW